MSKTAESTILETNEDSKVTPVQLEDDPAPKLQGNDVKAGLAAWSELTTNGDKVLGKAFSEFSGASNKDKAFIHENFSSRSFESHSPQLRKRAAAGDVPSDLSLSERANGLLPR